ncbi:MAG: histidine kinase, partial [Mesorhizobium sp.]|nr:histidine kinase [Mesorhizobium sp.]
MKRLFAVAVFLSVGVASLFMAGYAYVAAGDAAQIKFESAIDEAVSRIESRIELHIALLRATHALFRTEQGVVSRDALRAFVEALDIEGHYAG